ncbi:MAG: GNAT family N-acetyltransferase [Candidatus Nealsonbacteria bacterium]|nr:GNAT family N-acetyltransferase [Candidatus Nealsonbacteria bacterium]
MSEVLIRKTNFFDIEFLWYLRNRPDVYKYSRNTRPVSWKEHIDFILPVVMGMTNKELFIIEKDKKPAGQIRFDYKKGKEAEISISLLREFRGRGMAQIAFKKAIALLKKNKKAKTILAQVHEKNKSSLKFFKKLGFKKKKKNGIWFEYFLRL